MNRLGLETSPYLRQHAENPVEWYAWGDEAFAEARRTDRPILLSIGYSSCHWCHVMAHESFADSDTAAVMNELFVSVKVDREERPDIDAIYMDAVISLTGRGGWPMTVFLTPDGEPFFGGTYFPDRARGGLPAFTDVLEAVASAWTDRRPDVLEQAESLAGSLDRSAGLRPSEHLPDVDLLDALTETLTAAYDGAWGGFGEPPKFPQTMSHEALLREHQRRGDGDVLAMVTNSLDAMASGGIYDHLGGGFCRYSVDAHWIVPHFEKMLYDNALLTRTYLHAWQLTGHERYLQVVDETIAYVLRDLRDPLGGFYAAEDADSEAVEGKFYVWSPDQINAVLGDDSPEFMNWFGVTEQGNFGGKNILWRPTRGDLLRPASIELSRHRLLQAREMRIRPDLDDLVLTEWNGLMLATLAEAALVSSNHQWLGAAVKNGEFLLDRLRRNDGRWLRAWQPDLENADRATDRESASERPLAYAADYAAIVDAFTRLAEATGRERWINEACTAADQLLDLFWDHDAGGVFTTGNDAPTLIARPKAITDNEVPSANSAAAMALLRLAALTGNGHYRERADAIFRLLVPVARQQPQSFAHLSAALAMARAGATEIVIPGEAQGLLDVVRLRYLPDAVLAWGEPYDSPLWEGRERGRAYVCRDFTCRQPASDAAALAAQLDDVGRGRAR